nr:hypothetical protein [Klebsiella variicola]
MQDLFFETIALQRIALFTKLVAKSNCSSDEKNVALDWLDELTTELVGRVDRIECKAPRPGGASCGGRAF